RRRPPLPVWERRSRLTRSEVGAGVFASEAVGLVVERPSLGFTTGIGDIRRRLRSTPVEAAIAFVGGARLRGRLGLACAVADDLVDIGYSLGAILIAQTHSADFVGIPIQTHIGSLCSVMVATTSLNHEV